MNSEKKILTPFLDDYDVIVYEGDCLDVMRHMHENQAELEAAA